MYCQTVAREKKRAHMEETYWGRPVPGFGDPHARVFILGLAPAAHGANRTGRVFTGDGSGDFLMRALHETGFANIPTSRTADDGLVLHEAYIAAAVRCAPPDNKPRPDEIRACRRHLDAEFDALPCVRVIVALGRIAFDAALALLGRRGMGVRPRPAFAHGAECAVPRGPLLIASYHPSRQNTNTGRLTAVMLREVFARARRGCKRPSGEGDCLRQLTSGRQLGLHSSGSGDFRCHTVPHVGGRKPSAGSCSRSCSPGRPEHSPRR